MKFIKDVLQQCSSREEFESRLKSVNLQLDIATKGNVRGIIDRNGKRTSWKRCGVQEKDLMRLMQREELTLIDQRLKRLERLQKANEKSKERSSNDLER